jgi:hypothetical protein
VSRLGERLLAAGLLTPEQLEQALRAQVLWGGRLGTNLIELGCLELDPIAIALGKQHGLPAALGRHFDFSDMVLQQGFPAELAAMHRVIPLLRVGERIAVASMDPLKRDAREEIAEALKVKPDQIVLSIAAEMRVRYHLERIYAIKRAARFLRSRGNSIPPFPQFDPDSMPFDMEEPTSPVVLPDPPAPTAPPAEAENLAAMIDAAVDTVSGPATPGGRERRTYVKTIVDEPAPDAEAEADETQALGRIPIRRVAVTSPPPTGRRRKTPTSLPDATRAIRRAPHRDRAADLIIDALTRFAPACEAAMLLVIRGEVATGWKYFCRDGTTPPELAVPMDQPGLCVSAAQRSCAARAPAGDLGPIDVLLLRALGQADGELVVVPIPIGDKIMCLIAAATEENAEIAPIEAVAKAAGAAFARLIRDASR